MKKSRANLVDYSIVIQPPEYKDPTKNLDAYSEEYEKALENYDSSEYDFLMKKYIEDREWLDQFYPCVSQTISTNRKILLIVGSETNVEQIWSMKNDNYKGVCYLEYEEKE